MRTVRCVATRTHHAGMWCLLPHRTQLPLRTRDYYSLSWWDSTEMLTRPESSQRLSDLSCSCHRVEQQTRPKQFRGSRSSRRRAPRPCSPWRRSPQRRWTPCGRSRRHPACRIAATTTPRRRKTPAPPRHPTVGAVDIGSPAGRLIDENSTRTVSTRAPTRQRLGPSRHTAISHHLRPFSRSHPWPTSVLPTYRIASETRLPRMNRRMTAPRGEAPLAKTMAPVVPLWGRAAPPKHGG